MEIRGTMEADFETIMEIYRYAPGCVPYERALLSVMFDSWLVLLCAHNVPVRKRPLSWKER